ncbi:MAG TPA: zinc-dependent alcohol dehydrogenase [Kineosporiaceae bacterium]|nr:zinc-dependent alcohol dehydrogenase [Kineosporiaceae bacterium]
MKAAVVTSFTQPLDVREVPVPEPGPGQVLIRMETCGLCHTDIHAARGDWPVKPTPPFIPGHEGVGIIEQLGPDVHQRQVGDRAAIPWLGDACGECRYCISGWETLCEQQQNSGYSIDGAFAEYAVASARYVVPVPDGVSSLDAAPLACAGVTTYKAAKVANIMPTHRVAVFGVRGLGHLAVQYAHIMGASVIAVDLDQAKLDLAIELGADHVVNARETDPVAAIQALGGADVAFALAVAPAAFEQAFRSLRRGGRLVCVALPPAASTCTPPGEPGSSPPDASSTTSTPLSTKCSQGPSPGASSSNSEPRPSALGGPAASSRARPDRPSTRTSHATGDLDAAQAVPRSRRCARPGASRSRWHRFRRPARVPRGSAPTYSVNHRLAHPGGPSCRSPTANGAGCRKWSRRSMPKTPSSPRACGLLDAPGRLGS